MSGWVKKDRPLTAILQAEGDELLRDSDVRRKDAVARNVWDLAVYGKVSFPDPSEESGVRTLKASVKDWRDTVQWLYNHCEGPYRVDPSDSDGIESVLSKSSSAELQALIRDFNETASKMQSASDGEDEG